MSNNYNNLRADYDIVNDSYVKYKGEYDNVLATKKFIEEKIKENNNKLLLNEKQLNEVKNNFNKMEIENKYLKQELNHFKEAYNDIETRKNIEIEIYINDISNLKSKQANLNDSIYLLETENADLKFEINKYKSDFQALKFDADHLTKIIESSNLAVKTAQEKEKNIEIFVKAHKKKVDETNLEKEKLLVKQNLLEKQIVKISEDCGKILQDKQGQLEKITDSYKTKFAEFSQMKDDDISMLKSELVSIRIEKDKYYSEFNILKKEYDKLFNTFKDENAKFIKKYEESESNAFKVQNILNDKNASLSRKNEKLEHDLIILDQELNVLRSSERLRDQTIIKMTQNEEKREKELLKIQEKLETVIKEKDFLEKEVVRTNVHFDVKFKQQQEQSTLKLSVLENTLKFQKDQSSAVEEKAFDMLKKQENVHFFIF